MTMIPLSSTTPVVSVEFLAQIAPFADYPEPDIEGALQTLLSASSDETSPALMHLRKFRDSIKNLSLEETQERFIETFDVVPSCIPYLSIHLFGEESFKRGAFMAELKQRYLELGYDPGSELPDHLSQFLRSLHLFPESEQRELVKFAILSPLRKMISSLKSTHIYLHLLNAIEATLVESFPGLVAEPLPVQQIQSCGTTPLSASGCSTPACESLVSGGDDQIKTFTEEIL